MSEPKVTERPRPYAARGARLRARKEELIAAGKLPGNHSKIAKSAGVSVSAFGQWERGETWPKDSRRERLAELMEWTVEELDGRQAAATTRGEDDVSSHPVSPDEFEILALYRGLEDQKPEAREKLKAMLHARHASQQHVRGALRPLKDKQVEDRMPITKPGVTKRMPAPKKQKPAAD